MNSVSDKHFLSRHEMKRTQNNFNCLKIQSSNSASQENEILSSENVSISSEEKQKRLLYKKIFKSSATAMLFCSIT